MVARNKPFIDSGGARLLIVVGVLLIGGAVGAHAYTRRELTRDMDGIKQLGALLTQVQHERDRATSAADSTRLAANIKERQYFLGRRSYHVPFTQARLERWGTPTGPGTILITLGGALIALGVYHLRRNRISPVN